MKHSSRDEKAILYWSPVGRPEEEHVLVDPNQFVATNNAALGESAVSLDGKLLAYTLKPNNADEATLYVKDVASGKDLPGEVIDGAKYESAKAAVEMEAPAMKLTMVIESAADDADGSISRKFIPLLAEMSLQEVLDQPFVQGLLGPLMERHWAGLELIRQRATSERGVIAFDITDQPTEGYNKFIPYYLHPEGTYNVGLSKSSFRTKVSVGTNPWTKKPVSELANISSICERYGGGGHARVGAISFPVDKEDEARLAAAQIAMDLRDRESA